VHLKYSTRGRSPWSFRSCQRLLETNAADRNLVIGLICGADGVAATAPVAEPNGPYTGVVGDLPESTSRSSSPRSCSRSARCSGGRLVEHVDATLGAHVRGDLEPLALADWIIDLGPGAGHDGGRIVFEGTPAELAAAQSTLTGERLAAFVGGRPKAVRSR